MSDTRTATGLWYPIEFKNDWGRLTFTVGGKPFVAGFRRLKWPDNYEELVEVVVRPFTTRVYDMGHEYDVQSEVPHILLDVHGVEVPVRLDTISRLLVFVP